jgi:hypothetical protein
MIVPSIAGTERFLVVNTMRSVHASWIPHRLLLSLILFNRIFIYG